MSTERFKRKQSEIINNKKKIILKIDQTQDFTFPNELYKYQIYCKNVSGSFIEDVELQIYNPSEIAIDEDEYLEGIKIGNLANGESHLLYVSARCSLPGEFTVHFLCYGEGSEVSIASKTISCDYNSYHKNTVHRIHIYNFSPYEETYELQVKDYSPDVTQLIKKQKLPYRAKENPFRFIASNLQQNIIADESQSYIDQKNILYGDRPYDVNDYNSPPYNTDEHSYQYLERENFNRDSVESYEGQNLNQIFNDINKYSKFFNVKKIKTGTNKLLNDFKQYDPNGFIYRFGLMSSEIFHNVGVLPEYSYMSDYLFTWAADDSFPQILEPKRLDMNWEANKWAGHGWNVYKKYTDEYIEQIKNNANYEPFSEFIYTFESLETAEEYINNEYKFDSSNEFYIHTENGLEKIRKFQYIIKESYYDQGVFFVHIPISKIPTNFPLLNTEQINAIIEKTKPFGMKGLIKYMVDVDFNINLGFQVYSKIKPIVSLRIPNITYKYNAIPYEICDVTEEVCYIKNNNTVTESRDSTKLMPKGTGYIQEFNINMNPNIEYDLPQPTNHSKIGFNTSIENNVYQCENDNSLNIFSQIQDLLYNGNFDSISFKINKMKSVLYKQKEDASNDAQDMSPISAVDYQLWTECLKENDPHSHWWETELIRNKYYSLTDVVNEPPVDFIEIPLENPQLRQQNIEIGIGFEDLQGKLHGISAELIEDLDSFRIKYATSLNNNFKIKKEGICEIIGLAYKFVHTHSKTLVTFLLKIENEDESINYHYFHHVIVNSIKRFFCFTRNNKKLDTIRKWSNLIRFGNESNPVVTFNVPQYQEIKTYDPKTIVNLDTTSWKNLSRIDRNEHSYAVIENQSTTEQIVDDVIIHFDEIDVPDDAIIQNIQLKTIMETNSYKTIYPAIRVQDGYITNESILNKISLHPAEIECYPLKNKNLYYYQTEYEKAKNNQTEETITLLEDKISANKLLNESLDYSTDYTENADDYITIKKPFWIELSDFTENTIIFNDIHEIKFCIEGYNNGGEVYLHTQLKNDESFAQESSTLIQTGYFKTYIHLNSINSFYLDDVQLRFYFERLNNSIQIFDTYLDVEFKEKQNIIEEFEETDFIDIEKKKTIVIDLPNNVYGYLLRNGLTTKIGFEDLNSGEYYRIYSVELIIVYQKQNVSFLINSNNPRIDNNNTLTVVNGDINSNVSGMFFNELIMPESYQSSSISDSSGKGIKLTDALYQSFKATTDNITSITLFPNGFVGNPDLNLKIALYENKGNTPNKLIKEVRVMGWSKANDQLKNSSIITYDFNVNNLIVGSTYWLKIAVDTPSEDNYYLLKYNDTPFGQFKLLKTSNNNYINTFGALKFYINTLNSFKSFNSLPVSEDNVEFSDPKILINLSKKIGEAKKLKVQKVL